MAKTLKVSIELEMQVPDEWQIVETGDGIGVLKTGESEYLDLTFEPMVTRNIDGPWTNDVTDQFMDELFDMVESEMVSYDLRHTLN